jgi:cytochrome d ubiquinol oxidase subunit I
MINGQAHVTSWLQVIFNPSFPYRFSHMLLASGLTVSFLVAGISAYRWLRQDRGADVRAALRTGVYLAAFLIPVQILVGDMHGLNTLEHQPAKVAAMEGIWETQKGAPAVLFALPNKETRSNDYEIVIPGLASLYLTHSWTGEIKGLNDFDGKHPPVAPVFWAFRVMVGTGVLMLLVSWLSVWQLKPWQRLSPGQARRELQDWQARIWVAMTFAGWVALIAGWYVTEVGRQPWLVTGILTAADAASKVPAAHIGLTLTLYLLLYVVLLSAYISVLFYLARKGTPPQEDALTTDTPSNAKEGLTHG